jgi:hypothetical protein
MINARCSYEQRAFPYHAHGNTARTPYACMDTTVMMSTRINSIQFNTLFNARSASVG